MSLGDSQLLEKFDCIRVWQREGQRAVHKPLLVLLALSRIWRGEAAAVEFGVIEGDLKKLLARFGPSSAVNTPQLPFWHLKSDGIWTLAGPPEVVQRAATAIPPLTELRGISGGFAPDVLEALGRDRFLIPQIARRIVEAHFPESLQQDVLDAVGLEPGEAGMAQGQGPGRPRRDPSFRARVLLAYESRCCVCGHDFRLGGEVVGLEAAHIKWFQAGGPDIEPNGLALCSLHHKLFDLGVFTVLPNQYTMVVSQHMTGGDQARDRMLTYHGAALIRPQSSAYLPKAEFLEWHAEEVFKEPARGS